jgi:hypothetical protein
VVRWFGAVQAQDYPGALWAIGMRVAGAAQADIERAVAERTIVRSWPLRGTYHFVAAEDLRWILAHLASRVVASAARRFEQFELDARTFRRSSTLLVKALQGGRSLPRRQLYAIFERAGIATRGNRGVHILWRFAQDGLICCGARQGAQQTFALLDEWLPSTPVIDRDRALRELARRYFTSHGPATLQDFGWWSGLAAADTRAAIEMAAAGLVREPIDGTDYWHAEPAAANRPRSSSRLPHGLLLPPYDEYTVAYRDRRAALDPKHAAAARNGIFSPTVLIDGRIVGTWTRRLAGASVTIALRPFAPLTGVRRRVVAAAARRYGLFSGAPVRVFYPATGGSARPPSKTK